MWEGFGAPGFIWDRGNVEYRWEEEKNQKDGGKLLLESLKITNIIFVYENLGSWLKHTQWWRKPKQQRWYNLPKNW